MVCSPSGAATALIESRADLSSDGYTQSLHVRRDGSFQPVCDMGRAAWFAWTDESHVIFPREITAFSTSFTIADITGGRTAYSQQLPVSVKSIRHIEGSLFAAQCVISSACPDYHLLDEAGRRAYRSEAEAERGYQVIDELPFWFNGNTFLNKKRNALFLIDIKTGSCTRITAPLFQVCTYCVIEGEIYYEGEEYETKALLVHDIYKYVPGAEAAVCLYCGKGYNMGNGMPTDSGGLFQWGGRLMMLASTHLLLDRRLHKSFYTVDRQSGAIELFCDYPMSTNSSVGSDCRYGGSSAFTGDGNHVYFRSTIRNASWLMALDENGTVEPVVKFEGSVDDIAGGGGNLFFIGMQKQALQECYMVSCGSFTQISAFNAAALTDCYVAQPRPISFQSHGQDMDGFVLLPKDYDERSSYPAILDIHGGPNTVYGVVYYHEMQLWANLGYIVFFCNPEGSEGRGDAYLNISGRYGREDYESIMTFTDLVLDAYPQIDRRRLCVTGGSYGGFMTNWIIGHTDRFACAATQRSISNWTTMITISDIGYHFTKDQTRGSLTEHLDRVWEQSPLKYVANVKTPTLFIHSDTDYRCPIDQGLQFFSALKDRGIEARMCMFHGENHDLSRSGKPLHRIRRLQEITDWFEKHVK